MSQSKQISVSASEHRTLQSVSNLLPVPVMYSSVRTGYQTQSSTAVWPVKSERVENERELEMFLSPQMFSDNSLHTPEHSPHIPALPQSPAQV